MFDDRLSTIVYFADCLKDRYPEVFYPAKINLEANGITVKTISGTSNIWIRDYMPLQVDSHFVEFKYKKSFKKYPQLIVESELWSFLKDIYQVHLIMDGGTIVRGYDKAIITEKVIKDNNDMKRNDLIKKLENTFNCEIIVVPIEPGDTLGHADGICKFVDEKIILINDYSSIFDKDKKFIQYDKNLKKILLDYNLHIEILPYGYGEWDWNMTEKYFRKQYPFADEFNPGFGYYINFLLMKRVILAPVMNIPKDADVINTLKKFYPYCNIVAIDCSKLSMEGGLMNCITWNIIDDNILRWLKGKPIE